MRTLLRDPRHLQIAALASLVGWAVLGLDLDLDAPRAIACVGTALLVQIVASRLAGIAVDLRSALITGFSLCLLLRTGSMVVAGAAAFLAIASKFLIRPRGKHLFNPANFGLVAILLVSERAWVSPGQWGSTGILAVGMIGAGLLVVHRAARADITFGFLIAYGGLLVARALWLGDPVAIPLHQLSNGALLVFSFFMISDPKTTPDSRLGRVAYAVIVAAVAFGIRFTLYRGDGPIWALALCAPLVPWIDSWRPGRRYHWPSPSLPPTAPLPFRVPARRNR